MNVAHFGGLYSSKSDEGKVVPASNSLVLCSILYRKLHTVQLVASAFLYKFFIVLQLNAGKMCFSHQKGKAVIERAFKPVQVFVHKQAAYSMVLEKLKKEIFGANAPTAAQYYIAKANVIPVSTGDTITMAQADGAEHQVPWSLETYLKVSRIKYPSKAQFYCVQKLPGIDVYNNFFFTIMIIFCIILQTLMRMKICWMRPRVHVLVYLMILNPVLRIQRRGVILVMLALWVTTWIHLKVHY